MVGAAGEEVRIKPRRTGAHDEQIFAFPPARASAFFQVAVQNWGHTTPRIKNVDFLWAHFLEKAFP